jgi:hypothetical protein
VTNSWFPSSRLLLAICVTITAITLALGDGIPDWGPPGSPVGPPVLGEPESASGFGQSVDSGPEFARVAETGPRWNVRPEERRHRPPPCPHATYASRSADPTGRVSRRHQHAEGRSALIRHLWRGTVTFQQWGRGDRRTSVF